MPQRKPKEDSPDLFNQLTGSFDPDYFKKEVEPRLRVIEVKRVMKNGSQGDS